MRRKHEADKVIGLQLGNRGRRDLTIVHPLRLRRHQMSVVSEKPTLAAATGQHRGSQIQLIANKVPNFKANLSVCHILAFQHRRFFGFKVPAMAACIAGVFDQLGGCRNVADYVSAD